MFCLHRKREIPVRGRKLEDGMNECVCTKYRKREIPVRGRKLRASSIVILSVFIEKEKSP